MNNKFRAFFAIDLPEEAKKKIAQTIYELQQQKTLRNLQWVDPKKLHITLRFLGDITAEQFACFDNKINATLKSCDALQIEFTQLEIFPSPKQFHVLSITPHPVGPLTALSLIIDKEVINCGIPSENRPFKPHLTLARANGITRLDLKILTICELPHINFSANQVKLFKSESHPGGSIYTEIAAYNLKRTGE
jgi:RNA 2',3'-cyclic 3'-phosphodiesterase